MRSSLVTLAGLTLMISVAGEQLTRADPPRESPVARLRREGIRSVINGDPEKLAAAGFNLTIPWERPLAGAKKTTPPDAPTILRPEDIGPEAIEKVRNWALRCKQHDIIMMYMMYVAAEPSVRILTGLDAGGPGAHLLNYIGAGDRDSLNSGVKKIWPAHQYRHVVDSNGETARWAPCPLERRIWTGMIRPQLEVIARVLEETGVSGGAALELETYCFYSIYPGMASQKKAFCFCDHCFYGFARSRGESAPLDAVQPSVRFDWLTQRGLRRRYEQYLEDQMAGLVEEMMRAVRAINPEFLFGMYPYAPHWYYDALIRGSGTPELPCLLFPSSEYSSGYTSRTDPNRTFFGDTSTEAGVDHVRRRRLPALYAGGIWNFSEAALVAATDRLVRDANGYWMYTGRWSAERREAIRKLHTVVSRWSRDHPGRLPAGNLRVDAMSAAKQWVSEGKPDGITVGGDGIVARYDGEAAEVSLAAGDFESDEAVTSGWLGRGVLPKVDASVFRSGAASIRFGPAIGRSKPASPYLDQKVPGAKKGQSYELSFWARTAVRSGPTRLWVGQADSSQWPGYMWYHNYSLPPGDDWVRLRTGVSYGGTPPLVLRFWCPPTDAKLWLDDVRLRPVVARTLDVPLRPPPGATGWGRVDWKLSPRDARCEARIVDAEKGHDLMISLYAGDSLGPLAAIVGLTPVALRLEVCPSAAEPVILDKVEVRFTSR